MTTTIHDGLTAIQAALELLPKQMTSDRAVTMLLAIGGLESDFATRRQYNNGPAAGFWQFERNGGCKGVITHQASRHWMAAVCGWRKCDPTPTALWKAIQTDDVLAAAAARLLLWTDPQPLPPLGDSSSAWGTYYRNWRPGKPRPDAWPGQYATALQITRGLTL